MTELLPLIAILAVSGVVAGFVAGMLGVGGGIVTVPVLEYSLRFAGVPEEYRLHIAVATSLAAIIPTSISSARTHHGKGAVDWQLAKRWFLGARVEAADHADAPALSDEGAALLLTFWPSEFSQIRTEVRRRKYFDTETADEILLQVQFAIGAHGAHPF